MTSRERIKLAIEHKQTDRVPVDICGSKMTGIHVDEHTEIARYLGVDFEPAKVYDQFQMLARPDGIMRSFFGGDVIELENISESWEIENRGWKPWVTGAGNEVLMPAGFSPVSDQRGKLILHNSRGQIIAEMPEGGYYFDRVGATGHAADAPLMSPEKWYGMRPLYTEEHLRLLEKRAKFLHEYTDYAVMGGFARFSTTSTAGVAGQTITDWLCLLITDEDYCASIIEASARRAVENLELYLQAVGKYIDVITVSSTDYGTQQAELFNPEIFERIYKPNIKTVNDYIHKNSEAKTFYHSCGSIYNIIGHLADAGTDALNPVQTSAKNMDPAVLKREFGDRITFWGGGIDTQSVLQLGTPEEVRAQVRERIKIFAPGGGYVFAPVHNIQCRVPPENVIAMVEAAREPFPD